MTAQDQHEERSQHPPTVEITIDTKDRLSPRHTTGIALYRLGEVPDDRDLFEEREHGDDPKIERSEHPIEVHEDEIFYTVPSKLNPGSR